MKKYEESLSDSRYGIDATRIVAWDDLLAVFGLLSILERALEESEITMAGVSRLSGSMGASARVEYKIGPHEETLTGDALAEKLRAMITSLRTSLEDPRGAAGD
ncbi:hypothetical protein [Cryobacterium sp. Y57]|uniref:hypothetical protein n=1 Tax=Cryobacterium sp. Y57 TaxID=2048287 RepID=UPI0011B00452|nr:hypothetical protein [Cryobacterium sp. Y57]